MFPISEHAVYLFLCFCNARGYLSVISTNVFDLKELRKR